MMALVPYWRLIAEAVLASALLFSVWGYKTEAHRLEQELTVASTALVEANKTLSDMAVQRDDLMSSLWIAQKQASEIKVVYRDKIKIVKEQAIPVQCDAAIEWSIENAGDLAWETR